MKIEVDAGLNRVQFCTKCVISNQRPSSVVEFKANKKSAKHFIEFDEFGVCSACNYAKQKDEIIDWSIREEELIKTLDRFRRSSGYDVIVPGSGGKDSAFTSHILKYRYGMNPLTVTWAPHLYTEIGWKNFENWIHIGGIDNLLLTPNGKLHRTLTRLAFNNLLHPFQPFIVGQRIIGPRIAKLMGIPLVVYGENQAEYGNKVSENLSPTMQSSFFKGQHSDMLLGGVQISQIIKEFKFRINDFEPYLPLEESTRNDEIEVHYLGYYLKWDPQECFYYASENTGFSPAEERTEGSYSKYSSIDDKIDPFHYYTTLIKFGLGRASYDAAQEIRNHKITREEGISLVRQYDTEFPAKYFQEFLEYIDETEATFFQTIDRFRPRHLWEKSDEWRLKYPIWEA